MSGKEDDGENDEVKYLVAIPVLVGKFYGLIMTMTLVTTISQTGCVRLCGTGASLPRAGKRLALRLLRIHYLTQLNVIACQT